MMRYRVISKRKHFYTCQICALAYITAKALKSHFASVHPSMSCDVVELPSDPLEDEEFDDLSMNSNYLYKDEIYTLAKPPILSINNDPSTASSTQVSNNSTITGSVQVKLDGMDYDNSHSSAKLITLTAPINPAIQTGNQQLQSSANILPVYAIQVEQPTATLIHQNGQIAKKSSIQPGQPTVVHAAIPVQTKVIKEKKYSCIACNKSFSTIYNKRRHDDMFHNSNSTSTAEFKCSSCDKVFSSIYNKTRHENIHKPINERLKFKCIINDCNRGFTTQFILKMHIKKVHNMEVNF